MCLVLYFQVFFISNIKFELKINEKFKNKSFEYLVGIEII